MNMEKRIYDFLASLKLSPRTKFAYQNALEQYVKVVGNDAKLSVATYTIFLRSLNEKSASTQRVYTTAVMKYYAYNKYKNLTRLREITEMHIRKQGRRIIRYNRDAVEKVINYCKTLNGDVVDPSFGKHLEALRDRAFVLSLADTGLRISEACVLRVGDLDWISSRVILNDAGEKLTSIRISNRALGALRDYLQARSVIGSDTRKSLDSHPLFARHDIRASKRILPITAGGMWKAIKSRIEEAGLERNAVRIHDFRHHFVTKTYLAKGDLKLSQELARHKSASSTLRYAHIGDEIDVAYDELFNEGKDTSDNES